MDDQTFPPIRLDRAVRISDYPVDGRGSASDSSPLRACDFSQRRWRNDAVRLPLQTARPPRGKNAGGRHDARARRRLFGGGAGGLQRDDRFEAAPGVGASLGTARLSRHSRGWLRSAWLAAGLSALQLLLRSEEHTSELQSRQYLVCRL